MVVGSKINIVDASKAPFVCIVGKKATGQEVDGCSYMIKPCLTHCAELLLPRGSVILPDRLSNKRI